MTTKTSFVFPGQGSQKVGMAQDFVAAYPESKTVFEQASQALDLDIEALCFTENDKLNQTEFTQPAILTAEIAMLAGVQKEFPIAAEYFAGHSLGEYTALVAAGVIPFAEAVKIVRKRGALMQKAVPVGEGAMAALIADNIDTLDIASVVKGAGAEVANFNSKTQIVISGKAPAVAAASAQLKEKFPTMNIIQLNVSAPFHSSLMRNIEPEFEAFLKTLLPKFNLANASKVLSNYSGTFHTADTLLKNIVSQISGSVDWLANMRAVGGVSQDIIEIGPARVLTKFFTTIDVTARAVTDVRSMKKNLTPA